jgi:hypothetical protein
MLRLLIDTSVWLDLAQRRDGQKWIVPLRVLLHHGGLELLVPTVVVEEFDRNRPRLEAAVTTSVLDRFRQLRRELREFAGEQNEHIWLAETAQHIPLVNIRTADYPERRRYEPPSWWSSPVPLPALWRFGHRRFRRAGAWRLVDACRSVRVPRLSIRIGPVLEAICSVYGTADSRRLRDRRCWCHLFTALLLIAANIAKSAPAGTHRQRQVTAWPGQGSCCARGTRSAA